jgi:flagellar FliL protein
MADAEPPPAVAGGSMKKIMLLLLGALAVGGSGGAVAWWVMGRDTATAKPVPVIQPAFVPLEMFTVNLRAETGVPQHYMQIGITLKVSGDATADKIKAQMPEIRNRLLLVLSAKGANDLLNPEGKSSLARELQEEVAKLVDPGSASKNPSQATGVQTAAGTSDETPGAAAQATLTEAAEPRKSAQSVILGVLFTSFLIQ